MTKPPKDFADAGRLIGHPDLPRLLEQKLIELAFSKTNATVSFRAIELLLSMPRAEKDREFDDMETEDLIALETELTEVINAYKDNQSIEF